MLFSIYFERVLQRQKWFWSICSRVSPQQSRIGCTVGQMSGKQISIWVTQEMATRFFVTLSKNEELPRCAKFRKPCTSPRVWDIFAHTHPNPHRMYASKFAFEWSKTRIKRARTEKNRISNHESHCLFSTFSSPYKINKVQRDWNWIGKMAFSWKLVKSHFCATILLNSIHRIWYFIPIHRHSTFLPLHSSVCTFCSAQFSHGFTQTQCLAPFAYGASVLFKL